MNVRRFAFSTSLFIASVLTLAAAVSSASASQMAACMIESHDRCPDAMLWNCRTYTVYGQDFKDVEKDWFEYELAHAKSNSGAQEKLETLITEGVCPGPGGNQPPTTVDSKYIEDAQKRDTKVGKRLFKVLRKF